MMKNPGILSQVCTGHLIYQCQSTVGVQLEKHYLYLSSTEIKYIGQCISSFHTVKQKWRKIFIKYWQNIHEGAVK